MWQLRELINLVVTRDEFDGWLGGGLIQWLNGSLLCVSLSLSLFLSLFLACLVYCRLTLCWLHLPPSR